VSVLTNESFTPLEDSLARLDRAVSPLVGLVTGITSFLVADDEGRLPNCSCDAASIRRFHADAEPPTGNGAHPDTRRARAAAIGETIERYSGLFVPPDRLVRTTAAALGASTVPPARFALFHPKQHDSPGFPFAPYTEDTVTDFVEGMSLVDGSTSYLPAELVYMCPPTAYGRRIAYVTSSGLACGPTFTEAVLAALLELVERDAVMLAWKGRISLPQLDWAGHDVLEELEHRYFRVGGLSYSVLDGSGFLGVPVAIGVLRGARGSRTALAVGAGTAARVEDAWLKALTECFGVRSWLIVQAALHPDRLLPTADHVRSFDDHMRFFADDSRAGLARFLDSSPRRTRVADIAPLEGSTPRDQIDAVSARLGRLGITAYAVDVTSPDVDELGLKVARVIAPELCALDVLHTARYLGGARLYSAAYEAGLLPSRLRFSDLNPLPHPFP